MLPCGHLGQETWWRKLVMGQTWERILTPLTQTWSSLGVLLCSPPSARSGLLLGTDFVRLLFWARMVCGWLHAGQQKWPGDLWGSNGPTAWWNQLSLAHSSHSSLCFTAGKHPPPNQLHLKAYRCSYPPHYLNKIGCKHYCLGYLLLHNVFKLFEATVYEIPAPNCPVPVILKLSGTAAMQSLLPVCSPHPRIYFTSMCSPLYEATCCHAMEKVYFFHMGCADSVKPLV